MTVKSIGGLFRRLTLEAPSRVGDEAASAMTTWSSLGGLWAAIVPKAGREIIDAEGQAARISHEIEIRWRGDITAAMRLRDGATIYAIHAIRDRDGHRRRQICEAEELVP